MPTAYEAPCLDRLEQAVILRWPNADRSSDGWIGDQAHRARRSDHNPDPKTGVVRARDLDKDGRHVPTILASQFVHPSTRYVIHRARIWHVDSRFEPSQYTGDNDHSGHIHCSIQHTLTAERSIAPWKFISSAPTWGLLKPGMDGVWIKELQAYLNGHMASLRIDGDFGPATRDAVLSFQRAKRIQVDGIVGPQTRQALRTR